jgi:hypothetical protein
MTAWLILIGVVVGIAVAEWQHRNDGGNDAR